MVEPWKLVEPQEDPVTVIEHTFTGFVGTQWPDIVYELEFPDPDESDQL